MRKKDILELKKRFKKDSCTFTRMSGCYVDADKRVILDFSRTFLNLEEEEFFKYLEIAKKVLSGTIGNNLLELNFPNYEEGEGGKQYSLMQLKKSALKDDAMLKDFYQSIIDSYDYTGNFLILLFHDAYDVITRTKDNSKLDESEEVYEYILCAICPVSLAKPGLSYFEDGNRIGARVRDWIVEMPSVGFVFPAFIERSSDVNSVMYYTKNPKNSHPEIMEETLGCGSKQTAAEQKEAFTNIIINAVGGDEKKSSEVIMEIQENLNNIVDEHESISDKDDDPVTLTNDTILDVLADSGISEEVTSKIEKCYTAEFGDEPPVVEYLLDNKVLAANEQRRKEQHLEKQVRILQAKLDRTQNEAAADSNTNNQSETENTSDINTEETIVENTDVNVDSEVQNTDENVNYDVVLHVKPQKVSQITSQIIDGKKCIIIPMDDNEQANVNGVNTML